MEDLAFNGGTVQTLWIECGNLQAGRVASDNEREQIDKRLVEIVGEVTAATKVTATIQKRRAQMITSVASGAFLGLAIAMLATGIGNVVSNPKYRSAMCALQSAEHHVEHR